MTRLDRIRNFAIVSHIDHGKTTLTDRFLELTRTVPKSHFHQRFLDSNPIEQERGITIKLAPVRMSYTFEGVPYTLNLIDTPGHVDFGYEVSRSLAACEGAILLVDAVRGIQAQTLANLQQALENNLVIIPVINKIDLPNAVPEKISQQLQASLGFKPQEIIQISAKTGANVLQLIEAIIKRLPPPQGNSQKPFRALVFNSFYHPHQGVIAYIRVFDGQVKAEEELIFLANQAAFRAQGLGIFNPFLYPTSSLGAGEVGYLATGLKDMASCRVGDTITQVKTSSLVKALAGYKEPKPMVFMDFYPLDNQDFIQLKTALGKLRLMDASLDFKPTSSAVLGSGFKLGFQGLLHADITRERLEREFNVDLIGTSPSVEYQVELKRDKRLISVVSPADLPDPSLIKQIKEPYIKATIFTPQEYLGRVLTLCQDFRGELQNQEYFGHQVQLSYHLPLAELLAGFFSQLKSVSSGFASLDWEFLEFRPAEVVKLTVLLNQKPIEPLSKLVIRRRAEFIAHQLAKKLKALIPRQQFELPIQVAVGGKIIARETIKSFRKDVTAKLYGGDQTRKDKLLEKQKKGKKRLKQIGQISLTPEVFLGLTS
jgi:GTP-binding protein LepA